MFGNVIPSRKDMTDEEKAKYRAHYCGLCHVLNERYGKQGRLSLSFDMVFLELLLSDLMDKEETKGRERCPIRPLKDHDYIFTDMTGYAADMQMLLSYYSLLDDIHDEGKGEKREKKISPIMPAIESRYPRQSEALRNGLKALSERESANDSDPEAMALAFGRILSEVFIPDEKSFFRDDLGAIGCGLGRFIYLMDAYRDRKKDRKKGLYNPLSGSLDDKRIEEMLIDAASTASSAFERLPLDQHVSLLRNILYSGIWTGFKGKEE